MENASARNRSARAVRTRIWTLAPAPPELKRTSTVRVERPRTPLRGHLYLALQAARGRPIGRFLDQLREWEQLDAAAFDRQHHERLRSMLLHARQHVPLYATEPWQNALGQRVDRLEAWPILDRSVVRTRADELLATSNRHRHVVQRTSGSTGAPLRIALTPHAETWGWAHRYRGMLWHGIPAGAPALRLTADRLALRDFVLGQKNIAELHRPEMLEKAIHFLLTARPSLVTGSPSALFYLARCLREAGVRGPLVPVARAGGEQLFAFQRTEIEATLAYRVVDSYGCTEVGALAGECPAGSMHVYADHVHLEIVRPDGEPAAAGDLGDVLATSLANPAMPLVRYRIGDRARLSPEPCRCGLPHPVLKDLQARMEDTFMATDGSELHASELVERLARFFADPVSTGVRQVQFGQIDSQRWEVLVEAPGVPAPAQPGTRSWTALEERLAQCVRLVFGAECQVEARLVDAIPREKRKFRYYRAGHGGEEVQGSTPGT
jgi:phenylacetate-CoA ligase